MRNFGRHDYEVQDDISGELCLSSEMTRNKDGFLTQIADLDEDNPQETLNISKYIVQRPQTPVARFKSGTIPEGEIQSWDDL